MDSSTSHSEQEHKRPALDVIYPVGEEGLRMPEEDRSEEGLVFPREQELVFKIVPRQEPGSSKE